MHMKIQTVLKYISIQVANDKTHLELGGDALPAHHVLLRRWEQLLPLRQRHQLHKEAIRDAKPSSERPRLSRGGVLQLLAPEHNRPLGLAIVSAWENSTGTLRGRGSVLAVQLVVIVAVKAVEHDCPCCEGAHAGA